jgi:hypothetical protein
MMKGPYFATERFRSTARFYLNNSPNATCVTHYQIIEGERAPFLDVLEANLQSCQKSEEGVRHTSRRAMDNVNSNRLVAQKVRTFRFDEGDYTKDAYIRCKRTWKTILPHDHQPDRSNESTTRLVSFIRPFYVCAHQRYGALLGLQ